MKTLRIARTTDVATFDPLRYNDLGTGEVLNRMYSHLVVTDNADRYVYSPLVAEVRRSRAGARARYLMRLRDDALWHDGLPVTAADVELTSSPAICTPTATVRRRRPAGPRPLARASSGSARTTRKTAP